MDRDVLGGEDRDVFLGGGHGRIKERGLVHSKGGSGADFFGWGDRAYLGGRGGHDIFRRHRYLL